MIIENIILKLFFIIFTSFLSYINLGDNINNYKIRRRILIVMLIAIICFLMLVGRLIYINIGMSDFINKKAYEQWSRDVPINSGRGKIYDRNGKLIVGNKRTLTVVSINRQIKNKEATANSLSSVLKCDINLILKHLSKNVSVEIIKPEGRHISVEDASQIARLNLDGIYLATDATRYYPYDDLLGQTLGFTNIDNEGLTGLEYIYNDYLKENDGALKIYTDAKGNKMDNMVSYYSGSTPGFDIYLSIDLDVCRILDNIVKNAALKYNPKTIICGVSNVKTGQIVGISQYPFFSIENYKEYDQEIYNRNFLVWKSFEPGSTFKIVTYSAGLEENKFNLNEHINCTGGRTIGGSTMHCWKRKGHGSLSMLEVIENSCNCGFMDIGSRLGISTFMSYVKNYGFGQKTGIDLLGEATGILFNQNTMGPVDLACASFGQGNSTTPIQLMMAMSACVNGGNLLTPYLLNKVTDASNSLIYEGSTKIKRQVISKKTSDIMRYSLESVVAAGTSRGAYTNGYRVGAKTGTSQLKGENGGYSHSNFILSVLSAAPMNDPEYCVYFAIEEPQNTVQYAGVVVAPIICEIYEQILPVLSVKQDYENAMAKEYRYYIDEKYYTVEDYIGLMKEAIPKNYYYKLLIIGEGNKVIDQAPSAGTLVKEGGTVIIYLGN